MGGLAPQAGGVGEAVEAAQVEVFAAIGVGRVGPAGEVGQRGESGGGGGFGGQCFGRRQVAQQGQQHGLRVGTEVILAGLDGLNHLLAHPQIQRQLVLMEAKPVPQARQQVGGGVGAARHQAEQKRLFFFWGKNF